MEFYYSNYLKCCFRKNLRKKEYYLIKLVIPEEEFPNKTQKKKKKLRMILDNCTYPEGNKFPRFYLTKIGGEFLENLNF